MKWPFRSPRTHRRSDATLLVVEVREQLATAQTDRVALRLLLRRKWCRGGGPLHRQGIPTSFLQRGVAGLIKGQWLPILVCQLAARGSGGQAAESPAAAAFHRPGSPATPLATFGRTYVGSCHTLVKTTRVSTLPPWSPTTIAG